MNPFPEFGPAILRQMSKYLTSLSPSSLCTSLSSFFLLPASDHHQSSWIQAGILVSIKKKLERLREVVHTRTGMRLYGSSVLIMYDSVPEAWSRKRSNEIKIDFDGLTSVKLIDFAHSTISSPQYSGPDTGALLGISNLISILDQIESVTGLGDATVPPSCILRKASSLKGGINSCFPFLFHNFEYFLRTVALALDSIARRTPCTPSSIKFWRMGTIKHLLGKPCTSNSGFGAKSLN